MKQFFSKKSNLLISSIFAVLVFAGGKMYQFASEPTRPKNCNYIYPEGVDQTKPTNLKVEFPQNVIDFKQKGGFSNDASCLNKTSIYGVVKISKTEDISNALKFAKNNGIKITTAGQQHSMGGQSFVQNGLVMDMKGYKEMNLDKKNNVLNVQSGAIWADVQQFLDKEGLAVKAMQSINIFTVGGTISVNAHGIAHDPGQIGPTIRSMRVMLSNGEMVTVSPTQNSDLFRSVIGGYGLFGVILDVNLNVVPNEMYSWTRDFMDYSEFSEYYEKNIDGNENIGLLYGRLSMSPTSYLKDTMVHKYEKIDFDGQTPELQFPKHNWINRLVINFSKTGGLGRWTRWVLEKYVEPKIHICSRNQAMSQKEVCIVSRNQEMYDAMGYLKNKLKDTDILQEYFIPREKMQEFVDGLRKTVRENDANLLNVTIRVVSKDNVSSLPYAKEDMFAFVLYFNQKFNDKESEILRKTTVDLIDLATNTGGTYYLPYQLFYSKEQLRKAYPEIDNFFANKKRYDPKELFVNEWYNKYSK